MEKERIVLILVEIGEKTEHIFLGFVLAEKKYFSNSMLKKIAFEKR